MHGPLKVKFTAVLYIQCFIFCFTSLFMFNIIFLYSHLDILKKIFDFFGVTVCIFYCNACVSCYCYIAYDVDE